MRRCSGTRWRVGGLVLAAALALGAVLPGAPVGWAAPLAQTSGLQIGGTARVANTGGEAVNVRERPGLGSNVLGSLTEGTVVQLVAGPEVADGYRWWQINSTVLPTGWMGEPWLAPVAGAAAAGSPVATVAARPTASAAAAASPAASTNLTLPTPLVTVAPVGMGPGVAATPQAATTAVVSVVRGGTLQIGGQAVITVGAGDAANIRATPSTSAALAGTAPDGAIVSIVDGPTSAEGYRWWLVNWSGAIGWVIEGSLAPIR